MESEATVKLMRPCVRTVIQLSTQATMLVNRHTIKHSNQITISITKMALLNENDNNIFNRLVLLVT